MRLLSLARLPADVGLSLVKRVTSGALGVVRGASGGAAAPATPRPRHPDPSPPSVVPPDVRWAQEAPRRRARDEAQAAGRGNGRASVVAPPPAADEAQPPAADEAPPAAKEAPLPPPLPEQAKTIDDEPVAVAEVSDPGAEEGAGPEIHVAEPWKGYDRMNVKEIRSRLGRASAAELAAVQLHEAAGKNRRSVLAAVKARLSAPPSG